MPITLTVPLDLPDVRVLSHRMLEGGTVLIEVESTLQTARCHRCGRDIDWFHGFDRPIRLRHLPVFGRDVVIEIRPKRYLCPYCEGGPTTTQRCAWYDPRRPHTTAFEQDVLKRLIHSTVADISRQFGLGVKAVEGILDARLAPTVDWTLFSTMETLGIDEVALLKGHGHYVAVIWARDVDGQNHVLAVLPDRLRMTVQSFLENIPDGLKATVRWVCMDMWEGLCECGGGGPAESPGGGRSLSRRRSLPGRSGHLAAGRMSPTQRRPPPRARRTHRRVAAFAAPGMAVAESRSTRKDHRVVRADSGPGQCLYAAHPANRDL